MTKVLLLFFVDKSANLPVSFNLSRDSPVPGGPPPFLRGYNCASTLDLGAGDEVDNANESGCTGGMSLGIL